MKSKSTYTISSVRETYDLYNYHATKLVEPYNVPCVQLITIVNMTHGMFINLGKPSLN
jgi:hypothetical protein